MATKKQFNVMAVLYAAGGGIAAGVVTEVLESNVDSFKNNPKMTPLAIAGISAAGLYFAPEEYAPVFYGMIGASAGDIGAQLIQGNQNKNMSTEVIDFEMNDENLMLPELMSENIVTDEIQPPIDIDFTDSWA